MSFAPECLSADEFAVSPDRMPALIARFQADRDCLSRRYQVPFSAQRRDRMRRFLASWRQTLGQMPFDDLTRSDRADWLLLRSLLDAEGRELDQEEHSLTVAAPLLPFLEGLVALEERRLALDDVDAEGAAEDAGLCYDPDRFEVCSAFDL